MKINKLNKEMRDEFLISLAEISQKLSDLDELIDKKVPNHEIAWFDPRGDLVNSIESKLIIDLQARILDDFRLELTDSDRKICNKHFNEVSRKANLDYLKKHGHT